jgi:hypothetical protein
MGGENGDCKGNQLYNGRQEFAKFNVGRDGKTMFLDKLI